MRQLNTLITLGLIAVCSLAAASPAPTYLSFSGAIGADTLTAAGGVDVLNTVRGVNPGGRNWVLAKLEASVSADAVISAKGRGLLLASGEALATRGAVTHVAATLFCGAADATASRFSTAPFPLDTAGNFRIKGTLSADGINTAVLPATCTNPLLLIRSANPTTGVAGAWFAAGILNESDNDD